MELEKKKIQKFIYWDKDGLMGKGDQQTNQTNKKANQIKSKPSQPKETGDALIDQANPWAAAAAAFLANSLQFYSFFSLCPMLSNIPLEGLGQLPWSCPPPAPCASQPPSLEDNMRN